MEREVFPWLRVHRDHDDRLDRLSRVIDTAGDDPSGLATLLARTRTFQRARHAEGSAPRHLWLVPG